MVLTGPTMKCLWRTCRKENPDLAELVGVKTEDGVDKVVEAIVKEVETIQAQKKMKKKAAQKRRESYNSSSLVSSTPTHSPNDEVKVCLRRAVGDGRVHESCRRGRVGGGPRRQGLGRAGSRKSSRSDVAHDSRTAEGVEVSDWKGAVSSLGDLDQTPAAAKSSQLGRSGNIERYWIEVSDLVPKSPGCAL